MTRIENILVGVDLHHGDRLASPELDPESQAAVAEAFQLALAWDASITFCSILELSPQSQSLIEHDHEHIFSTVEDTAKEVLSTLELRAVAQNIHHRSILRFGIAWEELVKESASGDHDLVIVGTRSKPTATHFLFGSTSQKLLRYCSIPVWVVKPTELREVRDIAIATDLSPASLPAFHLAVTVARAIGARLHVIHVVELTDFRYLSMAGIADDELMQIQMRVITSAFESLQNQMHETDFRTLPHGVKLEVLNGSPDTEIAEYVASQSIDLLVMGTHGHRGFTGILLGNTAERILPGLHASLLAVKPVGYQSPYKS